MTNEITLATGPVAVTVLPPVARFNLRIAPANLAAASQALDLALPHTIGQGAARGARAAYCLGPDEWLIHAPETETAEICAAFDAIRATVAHSLTVLSDREITIAIDGERVEELLSIACSLNLARMQIGTAKRTVFDSAQIVLLREAPDRFRMEVWRSYFPHVHALLGIGNLELASGY